MESFEWRDELDKLHSRRRYMSNTAQREEKIYPLPTFDENDTVHKPFFYYLLPSERTIMKTSNAESMMRSEPQTKFFGTKEELDKFLEEPAAISSHDEDFPPVSEEVFFSDKTIDHFDKFHCNTSDCEVNPPLTSTQKRLLKSLAEFTIFNSDNQATVEVKKRNRKDIVRAHCKMLKRKRFARTYKRYTKIREKKLELNAEAQELREEEVKDKDLLRTEGVFCKPLMEIRAKAVQKKFDLYLKNAEFRSMYRKRVFFNVNLPVPEGEIEETAKSADEGASEAATTEAATSEPATSEVGLSEEPKDTQPTESDIRDQWLEVDKKMFDLYRREALNSFIQETGRNAAKLVYKNLRERRARER